MPGCCGEGVTCGGASGGTAATAAAVASASASAAVEIDRPDDIFTVDLGPVSMEKLQAGLLTKAWPRCRCAHGCDCSQASIAAADVVLPDPNNFDVVTKPCSCVKMHLYVVPDDCALGTSLYAPLLEPLLPYAVKPGLLGLEGGTCSVPLFESKLASHGAFHLPPRSRVLCFARGAGELAAGSGGVAMKSQLRVLLRPLPDDVAAKNNPQVFLSSRSALEHAASLSLPLAKVRLLSVGSTLRQAAAFTAPASYQGKAAPGTESAVVYLHVPSITCASCSSKIVKAFTKKGLVPARDFYVTVADKVVAVLASPAVLAAAGAASAEALRDTATAWLGSLGKPAEPLLVRSKVGCVRVEGVTCKGCVASIKKNCRPLADDFDFEARLVRNVPAEALEGLVDKINALQGGKYTASIGEVEEEGGAPVPAPTVLGVFVTRWEQRVQDATASTAPAVGGSSPSGDGGDVRVDMSSVSAQAPTPVAHADTGIRRNNSREYAQTSFIVRGMTCASCVGRIEDHLMGLPGVQSASVALSTETARVSHLVSVSRDVLARELTELGYTTTVVDEDTQDDLHRQLSREEEKSLLLRQAVYSLILALPSMLLMIFGPYFASLMALMDYVVYEHVTFGVCLQLATATPSVLIFGRGFFYRAVQAVQHSTLTMDVLVALGVGTAYLSGWIFVLFDIGTASADAASVLVGFMLLGKYFEAVAKGRTADELRSLLELRPTSALLVKPMDGGDGAVGPDTMFGEPTEVDVESIKKGDVVKVITGAQVPIDGVVVRGTMEVNQSMLTGESMPVVKKEQDAVAGATECVNGMAYIVATHVGADSTLSQIIRLINDAQASKAPIQKYADVIASRFVPVVLLFGFGSFAAWLLLGQLEAYPAEWRGEKSVLSFAMTFLLATLVVACPCAMGLATPTAVMVATGVGARLGIFIKGGETIEAAAAIRAVLFDKTGTLTTGKVKVVDAAYFPAKVGGAAGSPDERAASLALVREVEGSSQHPVASAVVAYCDAHVGGAAKVGGDNFNTVPGKGVSCTVDGKRVVAGQSRWVLSMCGSGGGGAAEVDAVTGEWHRRGCSVVLASVDNELLWGFAIQDSIKPEAEATVRHLQKTGRRVVMVTGDNRTTALKVAASLGIDEDDVRADVLPGDKADVVRSVQKECLKVMFVGDGINDAPALAAADVGVALGSGTSVAIDSADAVLTKSDLADVATLLQLSEVTLRRIKLNFLWAFGYNLLALPFASGLLFPLTRQQLPPVLGGMAMVMSSLLVLSSSLLLNLFAATDVYKSTGLRRQPFGSAGQKSYSTFV